MTLGEWWDRHATVVLLGVIGGCVVAWVVVMVLLARIDDTPAWWPGLDPASPEVIAEAEKLERAFANQVSLNRVPTDDDGTDWAVAVSEASANAWLAVRLRAWAENDGAAWPGGIDSVRVGFVDDKVALGARVMGAGGSCVVWVTLTPEVRRDGSVWLTAHAARVGGVRVPGDWALAGLQSDLEEEAPGTVEEGTLRSVLAGESALMLEPVVRLPDGRRVRILELHAKDGRFELSMRTEWGE